MTQKQIFLNLCNAGNKLGRKTTQEDKMQFPTTTALVLLKVFPYLEMKSK